MSVTLEDFDLNPWTLLLKYWDKIDYPRQDKQSTYKIMLRPVHEITCAVERNVLDISVCVCVRARVCVCVYIYAEKIYVLFVKSLK